MVYASEEAKVNEELTEFFSKFKKEGLYLTSASSNSAYVSERLWMTAVSTTASRSLNGDQEPKATKYILNF